MASEDIKRYRDNLRDELDGAALYTAIAAAERDPLRRDLFLQLAQAEARHAELWRGKLAAAGIQEERYVPSFRTRLLARLARRFGPGFVMPTVAAAEFADRDKYASQHDAQAISAEERGHARVVGAMAQAPAGGSVTGPDIARAEPWHRGASGNNLRAAVLGVSDGLVSNFCLVMGVAGAGTGNRVALLTGLAGLVAGACSMALGEWLSVTNARELATTQIAREAQEIEQTPQAEQHELALIYQAKGLQKSDAERVAAELMSDKSAALDTLAREELGVDPQELGGSPLAAATTSFALFAVGAIFPVLPFLALHGGAAVGVSIALSAAALCAVGLLTSLFNGRSPWFSAGRQMLFGCVAAAVTYGIGSLLGVSIS
ncbi:MAG: VIT1/CCC1 transporter family protein [Sinobacteraceae bacterium]|nr:VIT1/CCC1 transporter family protein [Nevskiaceae bacterium]MBV9316589.1 VIT1/CCC1 transporter family protein [Gammaproteobacteria bacterium]